MQPLDDYETPWRRAASELEPRLAAWASQRIGDGTKVTDLHEPGNGLSSETVLFDVVRTDGSVDCCAARLAPLAAVHPVFPEYDLDLQRRCMEIVRRRTDVPVPEILWHENDPTWLDTPFLVMRRVDGEAPPDLPPYVFTGWVLDATEEERARMQRGIVRVLAGVHEVSPATDDLRFLERPDHGATPMDQQLGYQRWYYEWARGDERYPLIERTFSWLEASRPAEPDPVLNWGDSRLGNVLFADWTPVAVLDWEMATVGPPEVDVAWAVFLHRFFQDLAQTFEMPGLPDFMRPDDVGAAYEELTGRRLQALDWYEVFAALRFAIVSVRTSTRDIAYGRREPPAEPDDLVMFRALLERMIA
jgi:aminoglycoside phosphotransferase (APT) family kinase protein